MLYGALKKFYVGLFLHKSSATASLGGGDSFILSITKQNYSEISFSKVGVVQLFRCSGI